MQSKLKNFLKYAIFLGLAVFLFWLAFRGQDIAGIKGRLQSANWWWAVVALLFGFLSNISRAIRWNMLIEPTGYKPRALNTFSAVVIGYLANLAVPRLGEVSRCAVLNRYEKIPLDVLIGTVVVERIVDVVSLILLLFMVIGLQFQLLSEFASNMLLTPVMNKVNALLQKGTLYYVIVFGVLSLLVFLFIIVLRRFRKSAMYARFIKVLKGFSAGLKSIGRLKNPVMFIVHTILIWTAYTFMSYVCFFSFDFTSHFGLIEGLTAMVFGGLGFVVPVQGGIGAYHIIVRETMMLYGLSYEEGLSFATLCHAAQTFGVILLGVIFVILLPIFNRNYKPNEQAGTH